ncbi:hypothetical protein CSOJ01_00198 [Colletotrichum sojae]|uniref:Uncharacterized protein n=1 Tax=Colletotrichum sojae TaxID=2175907 RepID=A0A8H6JZ05_9PEZI|nr:hypothetical protein CSOJ01_00198 [Colletotrichum sojae]
MPGGWSCPCAPSLLTAVHRDRPMSASETQGSERPGHHPRNHIETAWAKHRGNRHPARPLGEEKPSEEQPDIPEIWVIVEWK